MNKPRRLLVWGGVTVLIFSGLLVSRADDSSSPPSDEPEQLPVEHADCPYFSGPSERFMDLSVRRRLGPGRNTYRLANMTGQVTAMLNFVPPDSRTYSFAQTQQNGSIDSYIFGAMQAAKITPAPKTTDWEFIRRVTLDLTGRIPAPDRVLAFVSDTTPGKRANLINELMASPQWVDKWTMFYGDLFQNAQNKPSTGLQRYAQGRNAFYTWIKTSLANNKPYNQMAAELINAPGAVSTYDDGTVNYLVGGVVTGGPNQDIMDQMTANTFDTFLGITHVNCLLCHNGRGHLDQLSLWGSKTTRYQAWQLASFVSRTQATRTNITVGTAAQQYWALVDNGNFKTDYALNTTTGNRPSRVAPAGCKAGQPCYYVAPQYIFNGNSPQAGEPYRAALARNITGDFQFARAAVNYLWAYFFGQGMVDPPDTFDPMRLDPNNPPPAPWTLQPTNPALLDALAQHFIDGGYNVKALMTEIVNSDAYQMSSRYPGQWNDAWQPYFARKYVRRLWAEEIHDAITQSSGLLPSYTVTGFTDLGFDKPSYAMQLPEALNTNDGNANTVLTNFLRGNRDDQPRKQDGSILQALTLMNNQFVEARLATTGTTAAPLIKNNLSRANADLVSTLYLNILSRLPSTDELNKAQAALAGSNRTQAVQDLVWSLYNKVDFIFNY